MEGKFKMLKTQTAPCTSSTAKPITALSHLFGDEENEDQEEQLDDHLFLLTTLMRHRHQTLIDLVKNVKPDDMVTLAIIADENKDVKQIHRDIDEVLKQIKAFRRKRTEAQKRQKLS